MGGLFGSQHGADVLLPLRMSRENCCEQFLHLLGTVPRAGQQGLFILPGKCVHSGNGGIAGKHRALSGDGGPLRSRPFMAGYQISHGGVHALIFVRLGIEGPPGQIRSPKLPGSRKAGLLLQFQEMSHLLLPVSLPGEPELAEAVALFRQNADCQTAQRKVILPVEGNIIAQFPVIPIVVFYANCLSRQLVQVFPGHQVILCQPLNIAVRKAFGQILGRFLPL